MIGRRAVIGVSLLCALLAGAFGAPSAMAETKTTTAFTCVKKAEPAGEGFSREHCAAADAVGSLAKFEHVEIAPGKWTAFDATNEQTATETKASTDAVLTATIGGLKAIITSKKVTVTGELENFEDPETKAMDIKSRQIIHFTEVVLSGTLKTVEGCEIEGSALTTNELESTSLVNAMEAEYKPVTEAKGVIAVIKLEKCKTKSLNENGASITGTLKAIGDGATVETTKASTESTLKVAGQGASYTSKVTPRMTSGCLESPISATTVVDP
jgi:FlaG/FlaF family flagellin (archaellin)